MRDKVVVSYLRDIIAKHGANDHYWLVDNAIDIYSAMTRPKTFVDGVRYMLDGPTYLQSWSAIAGLVIAWACLDVVGKIIILLAKYLLGI